MSDAVAVALITGCTTVIGSIITTIITAIKNRENIVKEVQEAKAEVKEVKKTLNEHIASDNETKAVDSRTRINRFVNEVRKGEGFDEEFWKGILKDITYYKNYCADHPNFPNDVCLHSIAYIERKYDELLTTNGFEKIE